MIYTSDVVLEIEYENARDQSDNTDWLEHRYGKIIDCMTYDTYDNEMTGAYTCNVTVLLSSFNFRLISQRLLHTFNSTWYINVS